MGKFWIEVCLISARGLSRSSLWKLQWFAVGWINPKNQYCTNIDASGSANPVWKTKFATLIDVSEEELEKLALRVEVCSREPIFLTERIHGTATILLQEFLAKHAKKSETSRLGTEVGSYHLRKGNSNKPKGFVDVSIRISEEEDELSPSPGDGGYRIMNHGNHVTLATEDASSQTYSNQPVVPRNQENQSRASDDPSSRSSPTRPSIILRNRENQSDMASQQSLLAQNQANFSKPPVNALSYSPAAGPGTHQTQTRTPTPPPPPPPTNVGYIPTFLPRAENYPGTYINPPPAALESKRRPGFGMGLGAGALAAGAVIFGDDFLSAFDAPSGLQDASLTISTDPPFS